MVCRWLLRWARWLTLATIITCAVSFCKFEAKEGRSAGWWLWSKDVAVHIFGVIALDVLLDSLSNALSPAYTGNPIFKLALGLWIASNGHILDSVACMCTIVMKRRQYLVGLVIYAAYYTAPSSRILWTCGGYAIHLDPLVS